MRRTTSTERGSRADKLERARKAGARVLARADADYPASLLDLELPPDELYAAGSMDVLNGPCVAIVGTRLCSQSGERVAHEIAFALASLGVCIVSGLAKGIDAAAHRGALAASGRTCAVLGTGIDLNYPVGHASLQRRIRDEGLLLAEMHPGERPHKGSFPKRNRIIAALSSVTIVVEAGVPSGAVNTSDHALLLGRTVAAVPGSIEAACCLGSNLLLRDGAHVITSLADVLALVGLTRPSPSVPSREYSDEERTLLHALGERSLNTEQIVAEAGLPIAMCLGAISSLEMDGVIEASLTGEFRRRVSVGAGLFASESS